VGKVYLFDVVISSRHTIKVHDVVLVQLDICALT